MTDNVENSVKASDPKNDKTLAMMCHLSTLLGVIIPFGNIIAPLVIWSLKKNESALVDTQGKESINFQITMTLAMVAASLLMFVLIGFLLVPLVIVFNVVMIIIASVKVSNGEDFRYPLSLRLIK